MSGPTCPVCGLSPCWDESLCDADTLLLTESAYGTGRHFDSPVASCFESSEYGVWGYKANVGGEFCLWETGRSVSFRLVEPGEGYWPSPTDGGYWPTPMLFGRIDRVTFHVRRAPAQEADAPVFVGVRIGTQPQSPAFAATYLRPRLDDCNGAFVENGIVSSVRDDQRGDNDEIEHESRGDIRRALARANARVHELESRPLIHIVAGRLRRRLK